MRSAWSSWDDQSLLEECERGEDSTAVSYRKALDQLFPPGLRPIIERQYIGVTRNRDELRELLATTAH